MSNNIDLTYAAGIENVDFAIYDWLEKDLNLHCNDKDGFKKTPIIWVTPERAFQVKSNKEFRDLNGALTLPRITLERTSISKDLRNNVVYNTNLPPKNNRHIISRRINQKKTSEFANADYQKQYNGINFSKPKKNEKIVYEFKSMLLPVYATFTYSINVFTQFQQQMNELLQPFLAKTGSTKYFIVERDGYKYECFIENNIDIKNNISNMDEEERRYTSVITLKVFANLISSGVNEDDTVIKTFENAVDIKLPRDGIIVEPLAEPRPEKQLAQQLGTNFARQIGSNVAIKKTFTIGNGSDFLYTVKHDLNTRDMYATVRENFPPYSNVVVTIEFIDLNNLSIDMAFPIPNDSYVVTIIG